MENIFRIELNFAGTFICCIAIWLFYKQIKKLNQENKIFLVLTYITLIELSLDTVFWLVDSNHFVMDREINILINTLYYAFQIIQCYVWMLYCETHLKCKKTVCKKIILSIALAIGLSLLVVNLWNGCVFAVDSNNVYTRSWGIHGTLEALLCLFYPTYCIILCMFKIIKNKRTNKRDGVYLLFVSMVPIISTFIQMKFYGLNFIWIGMSLASLLILIEIEVKEYRRLQKELEEQKIKIMLSQIQPHFLYNTLSSIVYLCDENPHQAKEATIAFSEYLRVNLDSLKQTKPIAFNEELDHIKIYLSLEKMRFEERLNIIYDIGVIDFRIPILTIQPIVENAVKHGVAKKEAGGTVKISTKEEQENYLIIIEDDGVGFNINEKKNDGRTHIGIDNAKNRLREMCSGNLLILSSVGKGTVATIIIPK